VLQENETKPSKNWILVLGLAMSLPTTIFGAAWFLFYLAKEQYIGYPLAAIIFIAIIVNTFVMMLRYAKRNKNKS
jgi:multidrug efflux pump subunit AcrB